MARRGPRTPTTDGRGRRVRPESGRASGRAADRAGKDRAGKDRGEEGRPESGRAGRGAEPGRAEEGLSRGGRAEGGRAGRDGAGDRRDRAARGGRVADAVPARPAAAERARRIREERARKRDRLPAPPKRRDDLRFKIRRRIALAVLVLGVLAALGGGFWAVLLYTGIAKVEQVDVTGTLAVSRESVLAAAAVESGVPLATVDTKAVAQRVAQLPGVGSVQVSRGWPHTVAIEVTERSAVALARTPQGVTLVDATGVAYQPAPEVPPALPMFGFGAVGPDDPSTRAALAVLAALPEDLRSRVTTVDVDSPATEPTVRLGMGDRQVRFGSTDRAAQKVAVLVPLLTQEGSVFDVSSPDLPTITR